MESPNRRIFHLITSLEGGGTENFLFQILAASPSGYQHRVAFLKNDGVIGERIRKLGIPVQTVGSAASLHGLLKAERPDVLHTCLYRAHQVGRVIGHWAKVPWILSSQRSIDAWQMPWHAWIDTWTLRWCNTVLVNSQAAERLIAKRRGSRPNPNIVRINNGIDPSAINQQDRTQAREVYRLPADAVVGGTMMRLHPEKGADWIPGFTRELLTSNPRVHFVVAGVGPLEESLRRQTEGAPWRDRLHWIGWENERVRFLSALDFFWSLSREESFPQTLVEAAAMGLPCIAPDVGDIRQLLTMAENGIVYAPPGPMEAARAAGQLLKNLNAYRENAVKGALVIRDGFSIEKMVHSFYNQISRPYRG